ncbi:histidine protein methyltransferase 1 homolog [Diadema setosum]|uniref:histidine protein methyltransferase 1 homolog n=1 Tax=Diadema setosum TaxID=31175 RepID=UPI003B3AED34
MGDFKFDFSVSPEDENDNEASLSDGAEDGGKRPVPCVKNSPGKLELRPAKEIFVDQAENDPEVFDHKAVVSVECGPFHISYLSPERVEESVKECASVGLSAVKEALSDHSDLVPCVYEGGLKVWECSLDLVTFLEEESIPLSNQFVLELGCGTGLPGIYAMKKEARVHFQDYNEEVVELMTIPNVLLNSAQGLPGNQCRFFAGDWSYVQDLLEKEAIQYDVILTSETIYNVDSQPRLYQTIKALLKSSGTVFIAAKTHYFGVGGGTRQFEEYVQGLQEFDIECRKVISQGVQREILQMKFKKGR